MLDFDPDQHFLLEKSYAKTPGWSGVAVLTMTAPCLKRRSFIPACPTRRLQAYSITMAIESPGSNGAFGPTWEAAATTFPRAPGLVAFGVSRSETKASTVTVRYKLSEVCSRCCLDT